MQKKRRCYFLFSLFILSLLILSSSVRAADQQDQIGGFWLGDIQHFFVRGMPATPDKIGYIPVGQVDIAALLEGRFSNISWRTKLQATHSISSTVEENSSIVVQELNRVFRLTDSTTVSVGKRIYSLDQSYMIQPLGFFQKQTDLIDPTDSLAQSEGLPMIILSWVGPRASAAALYSKDFLHHADGFNRGIEQSLLKFGYEFDHFNAAIIVRSTTGESTGLGATFSGTFEDTLSYYGSYYGARGTQRPILCTIIKPACSIPEVGFFRSNDGVYYPRATLGIIYAAESLPRLQFEYSYDRRGLSTPEYARFIALARNGENQHTAMNQAWYMATTSMLIPQGIRRHYLSLSLMQSSQNMDMSGGVYTGLSDWSRIWYANFVYKFSVRVRASVSITHQSGPAYSERALSPLATTLAARVQYFF